jgi:hypothetical protein
MASYENGVPYTSYGREENPDCPVHNAPVKNKFQELGMEIKSSEETHGAVKCDHCGAIFGYHRIDAPTVRNQKS